MIIIIIILLIFGFIGYTIGEPKGKGTAGFWLGFLLGIIGIIIIAVLDEKPNNN